MQYPKSDGSKKSKHQIEEADLLKFQLLSAYVGMRTQELDSLQKDKELVEAKIEIAQLHLQRAQEEASKCHAWISDEYGLKEADQINYADGQIKRGTSNEESHARRESEEKEKEKEEGKA
jgi:hypothetical protein